MLPTFFVCVMSGPMWHQSHISGLFSSLTSPMRASWVAYRSGMPFSWFRERSKNWAQDRWMGRNRKNRFRMCGAIYYMRSKQLTVKMYSIEWLLVSDFHGNSMLVEMSLTGCTGCDAIVESVCAIIAELAGLEIGPYVELNGFLWTEPCSLQKGFQFSIPLIVSTYTRFDRLKCIFTAGLVLFFGETDFTPNFAPALIWSLTRGRNSNAVPSFRAFGEVRFLKRVYFSKVQALTQKRNASKAKCLASRKAQKAISLPPCVTTALPAMHSECRESHYHLKVALSSETRLAVVHAEMQYRCLSCGVCGMRPLHCKV